MAIHMTQIRNSLYSPDGDTRSENCGPTSLAMGLIHLSLKPPPLPKTQLGRATDDCLPPGASVQDWIDAARFAMFSDRGGRSLNQAKDGLDWTSGSPRKAWHKHQTLVNWEDLVRGADNSGALGVPLFNLDEVSHALKQAVPVLLAGDPSGPGSYGPAFGVEYQGGHIVLAVDYDGRYKVHDPLCTTGPIWLTGEHLLAFCGAGVLGDQIGLALHRQNERFEFQPGREAMSMSQMQSSNCTWAHTR